MYILYIPNDPINLLRSLYLSRFSCFYFIFIIIIVLNAFAVLEQKSCKKNLVQIL